MRASFPANHVDGFTDDATSTTHSGRAWRVPFDAIKLTKQRPRLRHAPLMPLWLIIASILGIMVLIALCRKASEEKTAPGMLRRRLADGQGEDEDYAASPASLEMIGMCLDPAGWSPMVSAPDAPRLSPFMVEEVLRDIEAGEGDSSSSLPSPEIAAGAISHDTGAWGDLRPGISRKRPAPDDGGDDGDDEQPGPSWRVAKFRASASDSQTWATPAHLHAGHLPAAPAARSPLLEYQPAATSPVVKGNMPVAVEHGGLPRSGAPSRHHPHSPGPGRGRGLPATPPTAPSPQAHLRLAGPSAVHREPPASVGPLTISGEGPSTSTSSRGPSVLPAPPGSPSQVHPYIHIPSIQPGVKPRLFSPDLAKTSVCLARKLVPHLKEMRLLLLKPVLDAAAVESLMTTAELLANHARNFMGFSVDSLIPVQAVEHLGRRFLLLDALHSAAQVLGPSMQLSAWWQDLLNRVPSSYNRDVTGPQRQIRVVVNLELARRLSHALELYKAGSAPTPEEVITLKRDLFHMPGAPGIFKHAEWDCWREDDVRR